MTSTHPIRRVRAIDDPVKLSEAGRILRHALDRRRSLTAHDRPEPARHVNTE